MKRGLAFLTTWMLLGGVVTTEVVAQKGMGDKTGVARQAEKPDVVTLSGKLTGVKTGPCEKTTGRARIGTHLLLQTTEGKDLNIHLGPDAFLDRFVDRLKVGQKLEVKGFRTEKLPADQYVACSLEYDGKTIQLRDETLRPFWAGGNGPARDAAGPQWGAGRAQGGGRCCGRGCGRGAGWGRGAGFGRGAGWGRGAGFGRGRGAGRGAGWGQGRGFVDRDRDGVCDNYRRR